MPIYRTGNNSYRVRLQHRRNASSGNDGAANTANGQFGVHNAEIPEAVRYRRSRIIAFEEVAAGGDAVASPAAIAAVGALPAPTARGAASTTPSAIVAVGTLPAPVARGAGTAAPGAIAGIGALPAPTVRGGVGAPFEPKQR